MEMRTILIEGRNCWRIAKARRVAFLVDGADYFAAFAASASRSQHSILAAGWDMDSRTRLFQDDRPRELPVELESFMDAVVTRRRELHAYLLNSSQGRSPPWATSRRPDRHATVRLVDFGLDTLIGMAPGIFSLAVFGERLEHAIRVPGIKSFAVLAVLLGLFVLAAGWIRYRLGKEEPPPKASRGW